MNFDGSVKSHRVGWRSAPSYAIEQLHGPDEQSQRDIKLLIFRDLPDAGEPVAMDKKGRLRADDRHHHRGRDRRLGQLPRAPCLKRKMNEDADGQIGRHLHRQEIRGIIVEGRQRRAHQRDAPAWNENGQKLRSRHELVNERKEDQEAEARDLMQDANLVGCEIMQIELALDIAAEALRRGEAKDPLSPGNFLHAKREQQSGTEDDRHDAGPEITRFSASLPQGKQVRSAGEESSRQWAEGGRPFDRPVLQAHGTEGLWRHQENGEKGQ
jgi:hypothetical protein